MNLDGLKLNCTLQLLVYVDINILGENVHSIKENAETLYWLVRGLD
jgi:hypothetical protein